MNATSGAVAAPIIGPALITLFGVDVPVLALGLSIGGLILARMIAPPPLRKLSGRQEVALTVLLLIVLFLIVTGQMPFLGGKPLGAGMSVIWGVGLGFSGLLAIEFFGQSVLGMLKGALGGFANGNKPEK
jgi:hypothetical protein